MPEVLPLPFIFPLIFHLYLEESQWTIFEIPNRAAFFFWFFWSFVELFGQVQTAET